ncbi:MAG: N,N-dimethylformamidase beta subunit family domain-containing protein, partial [Acidimicrobiales bacterium]
MLGMMTTLVVIAASPTPASAVGVCGPPVVSVVGCENSLPGDPRSDWQVSGSGDAGLQGFATVMSSKPGDTVSFKVNASAAAYHVDILRFGFYQGNGARKVASLVGPFPRNSQPACATQSSTGLVDCGNWSVSVSWTVPAGAVSGVYGAHLVRNDTGGSSLVPFVVRDEASHSAVVVQTSDETWQAYNSFGGNSLYGCTVACPPGNPLGYKGAFKVSYNRPFHSADDDGGRSWLTYAELPMISFLEANGYDVSYLSGGDVDSRGSLLSNHAVFVSSGHDEYWSANQRANVEAARDQGVDLAFFSGNESFWKTRWEPDGSGVANRTLVAYKDTHFDAPTDPVTWTGTWRDPRFRAGQPENALTGQYFTVNAGTTDIKVPAAYGGLRLWRNTAAASLGAGQSLTLGAGLGTLGYEWDIEPDNGFRPAGLFDLSSTTSSTAQTFIDYGSTTADNQSATHHLSLYRAPSGALVFGAGTVQWAWGLDAHNPTDGAVDRTMQQATVNLLADMGAQPATLIAGLTPATASPNRTPPTSTITTPTPGTSLADGATVTVTGTATATPGAVVAGVEVSPDN